MTTAGNDTAPAGKGRLVLEAIPDEAVREKVIALLCRSAAGATPEQVAQRLSSLPLVLSSSVSSSTGTRLAEKLRECGAQAVFIPGLSPGAAKLPAGPPSGEARSAHPRKGAAAAPSPGPELPTDAPVLILNAFLAVLVSLFSPVFYVVAIPLALYAVHRSGTVLEIHTEVRGFLLVGSFIPLLNAAILLVLLVMTSLSLRKKAKGLRKAVNDHRLRTLLMRFAVTPLMLIAMLGVFNGSLPDSAEGLVESVETQLKHEAAKFGKDLPRKANDNLTIDSVTAGPGKLLTYNCTLTKLTADRLDVPHFKEAVLPGIRKNVCSSKELKRYIDMDATFAYSFKGEDGLPIATVAIDSIACRQESMASESKGK